MPCAVTHLYLAERVLDHWARRAGAAPLPLERPELREAFLHGAMAPDMGFVPGVDRFVSELAHYVEPAELTRNLVGHTRSGREEAFAWGWVSHVLGDVTLHPMVGRAVGERLHGEAGRRMDAEEDLPTHVGMEVGLDLSLQARGTCGEPPPRRPFFGEGSAPLLERALASTYGLEWSPRALEAGHRRAVWMVWLWPRALHLLLREGTVGDRPGGLSGRFTSMLVRSARPFSSEESAARGFLTPLRPPPWLPEAVYRFGEEIGERMDALVESGLAALEDRNLETGGPAGPNLGHPASDRVALRLALVPRGRPYEPRESRSKMTPAAARSWIAIPRDLKRVI